MPVYQQEGPCIACRHPCSDVMADHAILCASRGKGFQGTTILEMQFITWQLVHLLAPPERTGLCFQGLSKDLLMFSYHYRQEDRTVPWTSQWCPLICSKHLKGQ